MRRILTLGSKYRVRTSFQPSRINYISNKRFYITPVMLQDISAHEDWQKAIDFGMEKKTTESIELFNNVLKWVEDKHGKDSPVTLMVYKNMMAAHFVAGLKDEEETIRLANIVINICKTKLIMKEPLNAIAEIENITRFTTELRPFEAISHIEEMIIMLEGDSGIDEKFDSQKEIILSYLYFTKGVINSQIRSYEIAKESFETTLVLVQKHKGELDDPSFEPCLKNNLAVATFWNSLVKIMDIKEEDKEKQESLDITEACKEEFKKARGLLKESLYYFEKYDSREYPNEEVKDKLLKFVNGTLPLLEDKWDELDDELSKQGLEEDVREQLITKKETFTPMGNLAEFALLLHNFKLGLPLLDAVVKSFKPLEFHTNYVFKYLSHMATAYSAMGLDVEGEDVFKNLLKLCPDEEILGKSNVLRAYASSLYNKDPQDKEATKMMDKANELYPVERPGGLPWLNLFKIICDLRFAAGYES